VISGLGDGVAGSGEGKWSVVSSAFWLCFWPWV